MRILHLPVFLCRPAAGLSQFTPAAQRCDGSLVAGGHELVDMLMSCGR